MTKFINSGYWRMESRKDFQGAEYYVGRLLLNVKLDTLHAMSDGNRFYAVRKQQCDAPECYSHFFWENKEFLRFNTRLLIP